MCRAGPGARYPPDDVLRDVARRQRRAAGAHRGGDQLRRTRALCGHLGAGPRPVPGARRLRGPRQRRPRRRLRRAGARHAGGRARGDDLPGLTPRRPGGRGVQRGAVRARQQSRRPDARFRLGGAHRHRRLGLDRRAAHPLHVPALPAAGTADVGGDRAARVSARADSLARFRALAPRHHVLPVSRPARRAHRPADGRRAGRRAVRDWGEGPARRGRCQMDPRGRHRARRHAPARLLAARSRRAPAERELAVRAVLSRKAAVLSRRLGSVPDAAPGRLHALHRRA